jgi:hypothetical protein
MLSDYVFPLSALGAVMEYLILMSKNIGPCIIEQTLIWGHK